jgi:hypothetical protein
MISNNSTFHISACPGGDVSPLAIGTAREYGLLRWGLETLADRPVDIAHPGPHDQ